MTTSGRSSTPTAPFCCACTSGGAHEHPSLMSPANGSPVNGLLLFLRVDDFDSCVARARALVGRLDDEPRMNSHTGTMEFSLRDPHGYHVMVSALSAA
jgi:predicted enzyme related to lactoylglutathione lyase